MATFGVSRNGKTVSIRVQLASDVYADHLFQYTFDHESIASLALDRINELIEGRVEMLVRAAYEMGWDDKRKKRSKKTEFTSCINSGRKDVAW